MALPDLDSSVGWSFGLVIDGIEIKHIQEIAGLKLEADLIELKHNTPDGKYINKKLPGRPKQGDVTCTFGFIESNKALRDWAKQGQHGDVAGARKHVAVNIYDFMGAPMATYELTNAWCKSYEVGNLKAGDTSVLTEKLTIAHEGIEAK
jgi:phage tail-like protein